MLRELNEKGWYEMCFGEVLYSLWLVHVILLFIGVVIEHPITMHIDNIFGYITIVEHIGIPTEEAHIHTSSFYSGLNWIWNRKNKFVCSEEKLSDILTKKLGNGTFKLFKSR